MNGIIRIQGERFLNLHPILLILSIQVKNSPSYVKFEKETFLASVKAIPCVHCNTNQERLRSLVAM